MTPFGLEVEGLSKRYGDARIVDNVSFDEAVVALFLRAPGVETLPLLIYGKLEFSPDPSVAAAATLMILMTVLVMIALDRVIGLERVAA